MLENEADKIQSLCWVKHLRCLCEYAVFHPLKIHNIGYIALSQMQLRLNHFNIFYDRILCILSAANLYLKRQDES